MLINFKCVLDLELQHFLFDVDLLIYQNLHGLLKQRKAE